MKEYIDKLISENDIKWLIDERFKIKQIISETRILLQESLLNWLHYSKYEKQIEENEQLIYYINKNI